MKNNNLKKIQQNNQNIQQKSKSYRYQKIKISGIPLAGLFKQVGEVISNTQINDHTIKFNTQSIY